MQKKIIHTYILTISLFSLSSQINCSQSPRSYISLMNKIAQKKDLSATMSDIVAVLNETTNEPISCDKLTSFFQTDIGKKLNNSYHNAMNLSCVFQLPVTTIGLFLYDFYQANILDSQTQRIGKLFEEYLLKLRSINSAINFDDTNTPNSFVKKHRALYNQSLIHKFLQDVQNSVLLIQNATLEQLQDQNYLETVLLPELGFDANKRHEFPSNLHPHHGKGLNSWQYPKQFAQFLISLSNSKIDTYLDIGSQHGSSFIIVTEYLKRFNPDIKSYAIDPYYYLMLDIYVNDINPNATYILDFSNSTRFINIAQMHWDLVSLDGDPSFEGTTQNYNLIKKNSDIIVINDIASDLCPGITSLWNILKKIYSKNSKVEEFTDQYEEVVKRQNKKYLGIGIIHKNSKK